MISLSVDLGGSMRALAELTNAGEREVPAMRAVGESIFQATQEQVHFISGDLKASGRLLFHWTPDGVFQLEIAYGGGQVDYAAIEMMRGGPHDFMAAWHERIQELRAAAFS